MIGSNHTEMEKKLLAQCEIGFEVGKVTPEAVGPISPTGEKYVELSNPGMEPVSTEKEAYELALATFHKYVARKEGNDHLLARAAGDREGQRRLEILHAPVGPRLSRAPRFLRPPKI